MTFQIFLLCLVVALGVAPAQTTSGVVISQVYGGGGNAGATITNDFVEIFNRSDQTFSLNGWSVQYASTTGNSWSRTPLSGTIEPGQYYLIGQARGGGGTTELPKPDANGTITMSATAGKVALVRTQSALTGEGPNDPNVVDFVGFGQANGSLGSPVEALSNTSAAIRRDGGCADRRNNSLDFLLGVPTPRNTASPRNPCSSISGPRITAVLNAASMAPGPIAPGTVVAIRGSGLGPAESVEGQRTADGTGITKASADVRALFNGVAAPLVRASSTLVVAIAPFGIAVGSESEVQVEYKNQSSQKVNLTIVSAAPAVFTGDSSGANQAIAWNEDGAANGKDSPAIPEAVITFLATGCGQTIPAMEDGQIHRGEPRKLAQSLKITIGGMEAEVVSAIGMPDQPAGYALITARIPAGVNYGGDIPIAFQTEEFISQYGVTVTIHGPVREPGTGERIEQTLTALRSAPLEFPVGEVPDDVSILPKEVLAVVSWNIQTGGTSTDARAERPPMVRDALQKLLAGTYQILVAQEIPNQASSDVLRSLLPGGGNHWQASFVDTADSMDNGVWYREGITVRDSFALFADSAPDEGGRPKSEHPPHVASMVAGDFDFTLISVHLTFADGDPRESAREINHILDYLDQYFSEPDHDPDVLVCGDFNLPSSLSDDDAPFGVFLDRIFEADPRFQFGERRFITTVTSDTSRRTRQNGGTPNRNYDHCVISADTLEELIQVRRVDPEILLSHPEDPEERLTSDHFPITGFFRIRGENVARDNRIKIR